MKTEEAVKGLKNLFDEYELDLPFTDSVEILNISIQALKKQIPKKPIDVCTPVVKWGVCPNCKGELNKLSIGKNRVFENQKYCIDCGQALDWSDTD